MRDVFIDACIGFVIAMAVALTVTMVTLFFLVAMTEDANEVVDPAPTFCAEMAVFCREFPGGECPAPPGDGGLLGPYLTLKLCGPVSTPTEVPLWAPEES